MTQAGNVFRGLRLKGGGKQMNIENDKWKFLRCRPSLDNIKDRQHEIIMQ